MNCSGNRSYRSSVRGVNPLCSSWAALDQTHLVVRERSTPGTHIPGMSPYSSCSNVRRFTTGRPFHVHQERRRLGKRGWQEGKNRVFDGFSESTWVATSRAGYTSTVYIVEISSQHTGFPQDTVAAIFWAFALHFPTQPGESMGLGW